MERPLQEIILRESAELLDTFQDLSPEKRQALLLYLRFLHQTEEVEYLDDATADRLSEEIIEEYRDAFQELAK